jgi:isopentenyl-diphosphate delta-isomerase
MSRTVLKADDSGDPGALVDKLEAHQLPGIRHFAFTVVLERNDKIILAKRSNNKFLWPGYWDGTVASHPSGDMSLLTAAGQRIGYELGVSMDSISNLSLEHKFEYRREYEEIGVEWEICHLLTGSLDCKEFDPEPSEVQTIKLIEIESLKSNLEADKLPLCPWFKIAVNELKL